MAERRLLQIGDPIPSEKDLIRWKEQIDKRVKGEYQLRYPTKTA